MFDPIAAIEAAREERVLRKSRHYKKRTSKLEKYRFEIVQMFKENASLDLITLHLETTYRLKASRSTVGRYLKNLGVERNG